MFYIPSIIQIFFPKLIWNKPNQNNEIYLTFDDGPIPVVTERVLAILEKHQIQATFFCIGDNVRKNPEIFLKIIENGHVIGNHTFNHLKGWKTSTSNYVENTILCLNEFKKFRIEQSNLFRPPYGRISMNQIKQLRKMGYKIVMWDVLSKDYNSQIDSNTIINQVLKYAKSGSIIVFHDSIKAKENVLNSLETIIIELKKRGFKFKGLS